MTKVFIGGSRRISRLNTDVRRKIDRIIEKRFPILIGDANGVDKAVQQYLYTKGYGLVEVFCAGEHCRNNVGSWPVRAIPTDEPKRDYNFYATKDRIMADEASVGLMIWDGKSVGTLLNVLRLIRQQKKVVIYVVPAKEFVDVKSAADWQGFVARCGVELRRRIEREAVFSQLHKGTPRQANLL